MQGVSSAFWLRLQGDAVELTDVIDVVTVNTTFHWTLGTTAITAPWSGNDTVYTPAPLMSQLRVKTSNDLSVQQGGFTFAMTGDVLPALLETEDIDFAEVNVRRVFIDTPGLGFLQVFEGEIGEQAHDRANISFSVRDRWQSLSRQWPQYQFQDTCIWRFGGAGCGFDVATVTVTFSHAAIAVSSSTRVNLLFTGTTLSGSYANDWFSLGRVVFAAGKNRGVVRTIRSHSGNLIQLSRPLPFAIDSTDVFSMSPGCRKRLIQDCTSKYNNVESGYSGFRWIPVLEDANQPHPRTD